MKLFQRHETILLNPEQSVDCIGLDVRVLCVSTMNNNK
jgi:hypothetical protein